MPRRTMKVYLLVVLPLVLVSYARAHGYVSDPANRASLWRINIKGAPIDYNDNQLFCGGYQHQWNLNGGKCGLCGDDYSLSRPRPYENNGANSRGIVVKTYRSGSIIPVTVEITANHHGFFIFHLCPLGSAQAMEEEECFDLYPLPLADGSGYRYYLNTWKTGEYETKLMLPKGVSCKRCVLRWQYTAGNSWGICENGTQGVGCGPQETFRTCSDISIVPASRETRGDSRTQSPLSELVKKLLRRPEVGKTAKKSEVEEKNAERRFVRGTERRKEDYKRQTIL